jgi:hypothetical protein
MPQSPNYVLVRNAPVPENPEKWFMTVMSLPIHTFIYVYIRNLIFFDSPACPGSNT